MIKMAFLRKSLTTRLIFYFLLFSLLPIVLLALISFSQVNRALRTTILEQTAINVSSKKESLERWRIAREQDVTFLAFSTEIPQMVNILLFRPNESSDIVYTNNLNRLSRYIDETLVLKPDLSELFILDLEGTVIYSSNPSNVGLNYSADFFLRQGRINTTVQKTYISPVTNKPTITIGAPVLDSDSQRIAVLAAHLNLERLDEIVFEADPTANTQSYLVTPDNLLISSPNRGLGTNTIITSEAINDTLAGEDGRGAYTNHNNVAVFGAYRWVDDLDLALLTETEQQTALQPINQLATTVLLITFAALLIVSMLVRLITNQIATPILSLTKTAVAVAGGDLSVTATIDTEDEIGTLARTFNQMTEQLRRVYQSLETQVNVRTAELAQSVDQLALINQVGQNANAELQMQTLLPAVTTLIRQRLGYYAVLIALMDENKENAFLAAADSETNIQPLLQNSSFSATTTSIIGTTMKERKSMIVPNVDEEPLYLASEHLPHTQSELALPLIVGDEILGVLDLQSNKLNAFSAEDMRVLQTLADQIAVAIQNARLFQTAQEAQSEAEEANRLKTQFLANMSHELRTPLNAVINFAYLLTAGIQGELNEGQKDMVDRIGNAGHHLLNLINDILDLAKIESGRLELYLEVVSLNEIVTSVMSTAVGLVRDKEVELTQEIPDNFPPIHADHGRVRQILLNLVSNAAKFTQEGHITVRADLSEADTIISVTDTGIGMAPEDIPRAFAEFVQIDGGLTRRTGGTGLGLPISKRFVEMHGGDMWVESKVGEGTTFFFTLPLATESVTQTTDE